MNTPHSRRRLVWALIAAGIAGSVVAFQSRMNGGLSQELDNGLLAAAVSLTCGMVVLSIITAFSPALRRGLRDIVAALRARRLGLWTLTGGLSGAAFVLGQATIAPIIGVALFTLGLVAGQVSGGLAMDRLGVGPSGRVDPTPQRIIGTVLVIIAVAIAFLGSMGDGELSWLLVAPVIIGAGVSWQFAVNGLLKAASGNAMAVAFVTFVVGTVVLGTGAGITVAVQGWPASWPTSIWLYLGGVFGIVFVSVSATLVRAAGVLLLGMATVAGQLASSVVIESVMPLANGVSLGMFIGACIALVAVTIAAIPSRKHPHNG